MYASLSQAMEKVETQVHKHTGKVKAAQKKVAPLTEPEAVETES